MSDFAALSLTRLYYTVYTVICISGFNRTTFEFTATTPAL
jgi:hypothetical protein